MDIDWEIVTRVLLIIIGATLLSRVLRLVLNRYFINQSRFLKNDATNYRFLSNAVSLIIAVIAAIIAIYTVPGLREISYTLLAGAGIFAAVIGFASQAAFSNIIGGTFIVIFKPFRVGDRLRVGLHYEGDVEDITLRHTVIRDFNNNRIVIPNSLISGETLVNKSIEDERNCVFFEVAITHASSIDKAFELIEEEALKHPLLLDGRTAADKSNDVSQVAVRVIGFGESSVIIRANLWVANASDGWVLKTDLNRSVKAAFDQNGVEMAIPLRKIVADDNRFGTD